MSRIKQQEEEEYDVVIIGAGPSGLSAAYKLLQETDVRFIVLEARDRVGGRCFKDFGAGYVDSTHRRVLTLAKVLGLTVKKVYDEGKHLLEAVPGRLRKFKTNGLPKGQSVKTLLALARLSSTIEVASDNLAKNSLDEPWLYEHAQGLDRISVYDFLTQFTGDEEAIAVIDLALRPVFGSEAKDVSMLWLLWTCCSCGSLSRLIAVTDGAQDYKLDVGFEGLCKAMVGELPQDCVRLEHVVRTINYLDEERVEIECENKVKFNAKQVIVALQATLYDCIKFEPALPQGKLALCEAFKKGRGAYTKCRLVYDAPWWRNRGYSGQLASMNGPAAYFIDDCKQQESGAEYALIAFLPKGAESTKWLALETEDNRREKLCEQLFQVYDCNECLSPSGYWEFTWEKETFTKGCVLALPPGSLESFRVIRESIGHERIHFAGTETASSFVGYVEGALESGERSAVRSLVGLGCAEVQRHEPTTKNPGMLVERTNNRGWLEHFLFGSRFQVHSDNKLHIQSRWCCWC